MMSEQNFGAKQIDRRYDTPDQLPSFVLYDRSGTPEVIEPLSATSHLSAKETYTPLAPSSVTETTFKSWERHPRLNPLVDANRKLEDGRYAVEWVKDDPETGSEGHLQFNDPELRKNYIKRNKQRRKNIDTFLKGQIVAREIAPIALEIISNDLVAEAQVPEAVQAMRTRFNLYEQYKYDPGNQITVEQLISELDTIFGRTEKPYGDAFKSKQPDQVQPGKYAFNKDGLPSIQKAAEVRAWSDEFLRRRSETAIPHLEQFYDEVCATLGVERTSLVAYLGVQGAGKGSLISTMNDIAMHYRSTEDVSAMSPTLQILLQEIDSNQSDNLETGTGKTGGIFNPAWRERKGLDANPRYIVHKNLGEAAGLTVQAGYLLNDATTYELVLYEMIKGTLVQNAQGDKKQVTIVGDVFPRSVGQGVWVEESLATMMESQGREFNLRPIHLELVNEEDAKLIKDNPGIAANVSRQLGGFLKTTSTTGHMNQHHFNAYTRAGLEDSDATRINHADTLGAAGEQMLGELADELPELLQSMPLQTAGWNDSQIQIAEQLHRVMSKSMSTSARRIAKRFAKELRGDESKASSLLTRFSEYYLNTMPAALGLGAEIVAADVTPERAIELMLEAKLRQIEPGYDFNSAEYLSLIDFAQSKHRGTIDGATRKN